MNSQTQLVQIDKKYLPFTLENGAVLDELTVAFEEYGQREAYGKNTILICHALTGDAHAAGSSVNTNGTLNTIPMLKAMKPGYLGWWDGMIGPGKTFDTDRFHVLCTNILGSCYGTTGPVSLNPHTQKRYMNEFPVVTVRDMVKVQKLFLEQLGITELLAVTGGSLGGMQALEWAIMYPGMVSGIIPLATAARHSDWCIGVNHLARQAIMNDPVWNKGNYAQQPEHGLSLAREIAMISYRSDTIFNERFQRDRVQQDGDAIDPANIFQVESYLNYQGKKLVQRFDANCYLRLSHAMDLHDVGLNRGGVARALAAIKAKALCLGIDSDILYPAHEQKTIAQQIPGAEYREIISKFGHDAFLVEFEQMDFIIRPFLDGLV